MYRIFFFLILSCIFLISHAQQSSPLISNLIESYKTATKEEKDSIDLILADIVKDFKAQQITSICGINFGTSRDEAFSILRNKYGIPEYNPNEMVLSFKKVKYAGIDFDSIHFLFQSDGRSSFLNACIFVKEGKNKSEVEEIIELFHTILSKKYKLSENLLPNGFKTYNGGFSPLWDGHWLSLYENLDKGDYLTGVHTDVIEYDNDLVKLYGNKYGVRLIYGPYNYVEDEF